MQPIYTPARSMPTRASTHRIISETEMFKLPAILDMAFKLAEFRPRSNNDT